MEIMIGLYLLLAAVANVAANDGDLPVAIAVVADDTGKTILSVLGQLLGEVKICCKGLPLVKVELNDFLLSDYICLFTTTFIVLSNFCWSTSGYLLHVYVMCTKRAVLKVLD